MCRNVEIHLFYKYCALVYKYGYSFQYKEYEQVVVEDRIEKEKARRKADQEAIELKNAVRVSFCIVLVLRWLYISHALPGIVIDWRDN